jgi:hypothetical protein
MRRLTIFPFLLLLVCASVARAQDFDYGTPDDLKGVTKVFVYTGTDLDARENIMKEITKKLPQITLTGNADEAEAVLQYGSVADKYFAGMHSTSDGYGTTSTSQYRKVQVGSGVVLKKGENNRMRLVLNFNDEQKSRFERRPSTNFARKFIDAYQKANGLKK